MEEGVAFSGFVSGPLALIGCLSSNYSPPFLSTVLHEELLNLHRAWTCCIEEFVFTAPFSYLDTTRAVTVAAATAL